MAAMRIVGGEFRGRRLVEPSSQAIRPTTDRSRESLFNILAHRWHGHLQDRLVMDAFAGTGALGLEALSRGAQFVTFIEKDPQAVRLIEQNVATLRVADRTRTLRRDATRPGLAGDNRPAALVFLDPPYGKQLGEQAAVAMLQYGWLEQDAVLVLEERKDKLPNTIPGFETEDLRVFGDTAFGLFSVCSQQ